MDAFAGLLQPGSVPIPRTRLIGRIAERATGRSLLLLDAVPLLTLTGPGGVGKTRLALAIASDVASRFAEGVVWVDLAPLANPTLLGVTVASALGLVPAADRPILDELARYLHPRQTLLFLDNCEHLQPATAELAGSLLAQCPALQVLATSRAPLHLHGEQIFETDPLPLPVQSAALTVIEQNDAVQLFTERARAVRPAFALTKANALTVAALCRQLDGLPLAIELAAARSTILSPQELLAQMRGRLHLLGHGMHNRPQRQQTIDAAITWSYDLLDTATQALFQQLSVFAGGFTLEAVQAVAGATGASSVVVDSLSALVDQSLVRRMDSGSEPRFAMLETIREFGLARLAEYGEHHQTRDRHAAYFQHLAEQAAPDVTAGRFAGGWFARLDDERDNIRVALAWLLEEGEAERALVTVGVMADYWYFRSDLIEGYRWCEQALALAAPENLPSLARQGALYGASSLSSLRGDLSRAYTLGQELLALAEAGEAPLDLARAHLALCLAERSPDRVESYLVHCRSAAARAREANATEWVAFSLQVLGQCGTGAEAETAGDKALALFHEIGSEWGQSSALRVLATESIKRGDLPRAARCYLQTFGLRNRTKERWGTVDDLIGTAEIVAVAGHSAEAAQMLATATVWAKTLDFAVLGHLERPAIGEVQASRHGTGETGDASSSVSLEDPVPTLPVSVLEPIWQEFAALLPPRPAVAPGHPLGCHRPRVPDRLVFEHVVAALVHGSGYERIASPGCSDRTIRRRLREWAEAGVAERLHALVLRHYDRMIGLDLADVMIDTCITKAPCGGEKAGRSPVDRGKQGLKRATATDADGVPLHLVSAGANRHDAPLLGPTLEGVGKGGPLPPDAAVHLDRAYDGAPSRALLDDLGLTGVIARKGVPAPLQAGQRWVVERTQAWMNGFGKLRRCTEKSGAVVDFYLFLAAAIVVTRRLIQRARLLYRWPDRPTTRRLK